MKYHEMYLPRKKASPQILTQRDVEIFGIMHFSINTFTDREWGYGDESPELFNPTDFDAEQIVRACRDGGLKGLVLVCKHHDGFCLWPTRTTEHNISKSPWRNGKGDLVREVSDACRKYGVKFGVYISPWDRNNPFYATKKYVEIYQGQIREVLTNYGPVFEMWFDGANGGDGWYGGANEKRNIGIAAEYYDWFTTYGMVRQLQPDATIFGQMDRRWCGNERGYLPHDSRASYSPDETAGEVISHLQHGDDNGQFFIQAECDFPLRPGWFWHAAQDGQTRSPEKLLNIYLNSVGLGGVMNIGIAPDKRGLITDEDAGKLRGFKHLLDLLRQRSVFRFVWRGCGKTTVTLSGEPFNVIELTENIEYGEQVKAYRLSFDGETISGVVVGNRRIHILPSVLSAQKMELEIDAEENTVVQIQAWLTPLNLNDELTEKV